MFACEAGLVRLADTHQFDGDCASIRSEGTRELVRLNLAIHLCNKLPHGFVLRRSIDAETFEVTR